MTREPSTRHLSTDELTRFLERLSHELPSKASAQPSLGVDPEAPTRLYERKRSLQERVRAAIGPSNVPSADPSLRPPVARGPSAERISIPSTPEAPQPRASQAPALAPSVKLARLLAVGVAKPERLEQPPTVLDLQLGGLASLQRPPRFSEPPRLPVRARRPLIVLVLALGGLVSLVVAAALGLSPPAPARARRLPPPAPVVAPGQLLPSEAVVVGSERAAGRPTVLPLSVSAPRTSEADGSAKTSASQVEQALTQAPARAGGSLPHEESRRAVDLLVSGDTRAALDAYRGLVRTAPASPALAQVVRLLERELRECAREESESCRR